METRVAPTLLLLRECTCRKHTVAPTNQTGLRTHVLLLYFHQLLAVTIDKVRHKTGLSLSKEKVCWMLLHVLLGHQSTVWNRYKQKEIRGMFGPSMPGQSFTNKTNLFCFVSLVCRWTVRFQPQLHSTRKRKERRNTVKIQYYLPKKIASKEIKESHNKKTTTCRSRKVSRREDEENKDTLSRV